MSAIAMEATNIIETLPESDQKFALEFLKKLVLAWDPDFTKLTKEEERRLNEAEDEYARGEYIEMNI